MQIFPSFVFITKILLTKTETFLPSMWYYFFFLVVLVLSRKKCVIGVVSVANYYAVINVPVCIISNVLIHHCVAFQEGNGFVRIVNRKRTENEDERKVSVFFVLCNFFLLILKICFLFLVFRYQLPDLTEDCSIWEKLVLGCVGSLLT